MTVDIFVRKLFSERLCFALCFHGCLWFVYVLLPMSLYDCCMFLFSQWVPMHIFNDLSRSVYVLCMSRPWVAVLLYDCSMSFIYMLFFNAFLWFGIICLWMYMICVWVFNELLWLVNVFFNEFLSFRYDLSMSFYELCMPFSMRFCDAVYVIISMTVYDLNMIYEWVSMISYDCQCAATICCMFLMCCILFIEPLWLLYVFWMRVYCVCMMCSMRLADVLDDFLWVSMICNTHSLSLYDSCMSSEYVSMLVYAIVYERRCVCMILNECLYVSHAFQWLSVMWICVSNESVWRVHAFPLSVYDHCMCFPWVSNLSMRCQCVSVMCVWLVCEFLLYL